jgi:hypothetical protein
MVRHNILRIGLATVLSVAVSQVFLVPAYAETIDLACTTRGLSVADLYVSIDTSANTVTWWFPPNNRGDYTAPVTIKDDTVTWILVNALNGSHTDATFDRNNGALTYQYSDRTRHLWDCKKTSRVF